ncbi:MAG: helix-turn-helix transcriptional regulator [Clostridiales bacterium]|nr:helix-turn-helix transcriptional regulator [Clostridiales bacterium]
MKCGKRFAFTHIPTPLLLLRNQGLSLQQVGTYIGGTSPSPIDYIRNLKIEKARQLLKLGSMTVTEVAYNTGYNDLGCFGRLYKNKTGRNPSDELPR